MVNGPSGFFLPGLVFFRRAIGMQLDNRAAQISDADRTANGAQRRSRKMRPRLGLLTTRQGRVGVVFLSRQPQRGSCGVNCCQDGRRDRSDISFPGRRRDKRKVSTNSYRISAERQVRYGNLLSADHLFTLGSAARPRRTPTPPTGSLRVQPRCRSQITGGKARLVRFLFLCRRAHPGHPPAQVIFSTL
jgi:hypothetical protein